MTAIHLVGGSASSLSRDFNICMHLIGTAKKLYNNGYFNSSHQDANGNDAHTLIATVITDLTALNLNLNSATQTEDFNAQNVSATLPSPVWDDSAGDAEDVTPSITGI